jgi:NADH:ubiquinone oxidoreductase subunit H
VIPTKEKSQKIIIIIKLISIIDFIAAYMAATNQTPYDMNTP